MAADVSVLHEREKDVLRLLLVGHDAKSIARHLDLSTHVVNERLRDARRKLGVGSSREAARLLAAAEGHDPKKFGNMEIGYADSAARVEKGEAEDAIHTRPPHQPISKGMFVMIAISTLLLVGTAYWAGTGSNAPAIAPAKAPTVVATLPANGSVIAPGPYKLTVTYDRPMAPRSFSIVQVDPATYPECSGAPVQSADGKSFTLQCTARAGKRHELWFNRKPYLNFRAAGTGQSATPYRLRFSVKP